MGGLQARIRSLAVSTWGARRRMWFGDVCRYAFHRTPAVVEHLVLAFIYLHLVATGARGARM